MDIATFKIVAPSLPSHIAVLMRGPTGVGKSHIARQIADVHGLPFIDVRGSTTVSYTHLTLPTNREV